MQFVLYATWSNRLSLPDGRRTPNYQYVFDTMHELQKFIDIWYDVGDIKLDDYLECYQIVVEK